MMRSQAEQLDAQDLLAHYRDQFNLPKSKIYLCGHSLGAMLKLTSSYVANIGQQWEQEAVCAWNKSDWINLPQKLGDKIAKLLGADSGEVIVTDSTSINLFKLLSGGLQLRPERNVILTDADNFPTDLYMAQAIANVDPKVKVVHCHRNDIPNRINQQTAVLLLSHVDYRTSELYDLEQMTKLAHAAGAIVIYDVSHSVGIMPLELNAHDVDMAVGCGYKYLNGGPGAPSFIFVAKRHQEQICSPLPGWMGHELPFQFKNKYIPAKGIRRLLCGTPSILSMSVLEASIDFYQAISLEELRSKMEKLSQYLIQLIAIKCPELKIISPLNSHARGGHIAFSHPSAYSIMKALYAKDIICDFREPDIIRFGLSPLYLRYQDIYDAATSLATIIKNEDYLHVEFNQKTLVP